MSYKHLTIKQRNSIEALLTEGYSMRKIANSLKVNVSTISREIKRCEKDNYVSEDAQKDYENKSKEKGKKIKLTSELKEIITSKLNEKWSPEQIVGRLYQGELSFKTIYNWIYKKLIDINLNLLRRKGKSRKSKETRGKFNIGTSILKRPKEVKTRETFGHWELDTIVSARGKSKGCLATFVERKTRYYIAIPMKDRSKESMFKAIKILLTLFPKESFKTFTSDRGKEFSCYKDVENIGIEFYFADPYSSWQRGTNENSNGLLREYYPKKTDLSTIDFVELVDNLIQLNNRPRKCLGFKTPLEALLHELDFLS